MTFEGLSLAGMATMTPKDFLLHLHKAGYRIMRNVARGITPTASGWDTPPSNLENATDGDLNTATGTGSKTVSGSAVIGEIQLDLASIHSCMVMVWVGIWSDQYSINVYIMSSNDGTTWYQTYPRIGYRDTRSEDYVILPITYLTGRYIKLNFYSNGAMTGYVKVYEIIALEVIP